jgi:hypothetical protein
LTIRWAFFLGAALFFAIRRTFFLGTTLFLAIRRTFLVTVFAFFLVALAFFIAVFIALFVGLAAFPVRFLQTAGRVFVMVMGVEGFTADKADSQYSKAATESHVLEKSHINPFDCYSKRSLKIYWPVI